MGADYSLKNRRKRLEILLGFFYIEYDYETKDIVFCSNFRISKEYIDDIKDTVNNQCLFITKNFDFLSKLTLSAIQECNIEENLLIFIKHLRNYK